MVKITVPVITGGKRVRICRTKIPTSRATAPPTTMAPAMADTPPAEAAACMLGT